MAKMDVVRSRRANLPDFFDRLGFSHPAYADLFVVDAAGSIIASNIDLGDVSHVLLALLSRLSQKRIEKNFAPICLPTSLTNWKGMFPASTLKRPWKSA